MHFRKFDLLDENLVLKYNSLHLAEGPEHTHFFFDW
jgi:hypothetical protein